MALSINPSLEFHGNDGPWSSFNLRLGTPPQMYRVLPATSQSTTWVVLPEGCGPTRPADCADLRGGIFDANQTVDASWARQVQSEDKPFYQLPFPSEAFLPNYSAAAEVGLDSFSLDWQNPKTSVPLVNQTIAGYASPIPWLGTLGISGWRSNFDNISVAQFGPLQYLKDNKSLPSLSWAYTAGAVNEVPRAFASLTFGGYDEARFDMDTALTVTFGADSAFDLSLWIESIELNGRTKTNARSVTNLPALIDSLVPEIWLPQNTCDDFASTFGLVWNDTAQLYLVNETQHADLLLQNPRVVFNLAANATFLEPISITLPYRAFYLQARYPIANISDNTTVLKYFPLRPLDARNTHMILGRTFLQYAYVVANYETTQFFIGPTIFPTDSRTISLKDIKSSSTKASLSKGAIAGIAVGAVVIIALIAGFGFWLWKKRRGKKLPADQMTYRTGSIGGETMTGDVEMSSIRGEWYSKPQSPIPPGSPAPEEEQVKSELDATTTAIFPVDKQMGRVELDAGSDGRKRPTHRHQSSWGSAGSGVSPISGMDRTSRNYFGEPSPPLEIASSGASSPPLSGRLHAPRRTSGGHTRDHSANSPSGLHELPE